MNVIIGARSKTNMRPSRANRHCVLRCERVDGGMVCRARIDPAAGWTAGAQRRRLRAGRGPKCAKSDGPDTTKGEAHGSSGRAIVAAGTATERFAPFRGDERHHRKRSEGVGPPPREQRVEREPAEQDG